MKALGKNNSQVSKVLSGNSVITFISGDPTSTPVAGFLNQLVYSISTGIIYKKTVAGGKDTNWEMYTVSSGGDMNVDFSNSIASTKNIDLGANKLVNVANPTDAQDGATKDYVDTAISGVCGFMDSNFSNAVASVNDINLGSNKLVAVADPTNAQDAATKNYVDTEISGIDLSGKMDADFDNALPSTKTLNLGGNFIADLADPTVAQHAATKNYVDTEISGIDLSSKMDTNFSNSIAATKDQDMGTNKIINVATPTNGTDVATKDYADTQAATRMATDFSNAQAAANPVSMGAFALTDVANPTNAGDAANKGYVDFEISQIDLSSKMDTNFSNSVAATKNQDLGNFKLVNVANPTLAQDAATKAYVDTEISGIDLSSKMDTNFSNSVSATKDQDLGSNKLVNVADPTDPQDGATKAYVDANAGAPSGNANTIPYYDASSDYQSDDAALYFNSVNFYKAIGGAITASAGPFSSTSISFNITGSLSQFYMTHGIFESTDLGNSNIQQSYISALSSTLGSAIFRSVILGNALTATSNVITNTSIMANTLTIDRAADSSIHVSSSTINANPQQSSVKGQVNFDNFFGNGFRSSVVHVEDLTMTQANSRIHSSSILSLGTSLNKLRDIIRSTLKIDGGFNSNSTTELDILDSDIHCGGGNSEISDNITRSSLKGTKNISGEVTDSSIFGEGQSLDLVDKAVIYGGVTSTGLSARSLVLAQTASYAACANSIVMGLTVNNSGGVYIASIVSSSGGGSTSYANRTITRSLALTSNGLAGSSGSVDDSILLGNINIAGSCDASIVLGSNSLTGGNVINSAIFGDSHTFNNQITNSIVSGQEITHNGGTNFAAFGEGLTVNGDDQTLVGKYASSSIDTAFLVGIGSSGSSKKALEVFKQNIVETFGGRRKAIRVSANNSETLTVEDNYFQQAGGAGASLALPSVVGNTRTHFVIKNTDGAENLTVNPDGAETIGGAASLVLAAGEKAEIIADASSTDWKVF